MRQGRWAVNLIEELQSQGVLKTPAIRRAFEKIDRQNFVPKDLRELAYENVPLPVGWNQTISQPYTVAFMLELLQPAAGNYILDIGYGSGWQTALLAEIVGKTGRIFAIELVPALCEFGKTNVEKYPELIERVEFFCKNAVSGLPETAKTIGGFTGIVAAAEVPEIPQAWREQLKIKGKLVYPSRGSIFREIKIGDKDFEKVEYPGFAFVPFVMP